MGKKSLHRIKMRAICSCLVLCLSTFFTPLSTNATSVKEQNIAANQTIAIESNALDNWPTGPIVSAQSAILMDFDTGVILYEKNVHAKQYPASTTKILTTLIASEECELNETVTFSHDAVFSIPSNSNHVAMNVGDTLNMEQCLQAILIRSANEVSYAVAEHIGGSFEGFADIMNKRAKELGCVDSHFVNPNGLPDEDHYTSAYDLACIGRAFFANELLCQMTQMPMLHLVKSNGELNDANQMELLPGKKYAYAPVIGCKTGYTDAARSCLVSCAEKDGMKLICVVLRDEAPRQYEDTIALFNYGFSNFQKINISQVETKYNIEQKNSYTDNDVLGNSKPILSLNQEDCLILPQTIPFEALQSDISYQTTKPGQVAVINYTYHGILLGSASVDFASDDKDSYTFDTAPEEEQEKPKLPTVIFINVLKIFLWIVGIAAVVFVAIFVYGTLKRYDAKHPNSRRNWKRDRRKQRRLIPSRRTSTAARRRDAIRQAKRRQKKAQLNFRNKNNSPDF